MHRKHDASRRMSVGEAIVEPAESTVPGSANDDVDRALAAFGGTGFTYHTFGKFSLHPRVPIVTQPAGSVTAPPSNAAAPAPAVRAAEIRLTPVEVADAEADGVPPPAAAPVRPLRFMPRPPEPPQAAPPRPVPAPPAPAPAPVMRMPASPPPAEPVSRLAALRARRAAAGGAGAPPPPGAAPPAADPFGLHIDWATAEAERPPPAPPAAAPPRAAPVEETDLFRRL